MKVIERRALRGPNIYSARPVYLAIIDLEALNDVASTAIPGFTESLLAAVPTLHEHRCSPGYVGGFVERLQDGTYMAHIVEHLAIELQCLAGLSVGFGKARMVAGKPGLYRVIFAYKVESVAEAALNLAIELVSALTQGQPAVLEPGLTQLCKLAQAETLGPSTSAIIEAARQRGIPTLRLSEHSSLFQLGWGVKQQRIQATMTSNTNHIAVGIASDKDLTKCLLSDAGLPVPQGQVVSTPEQAHRAQREYGSVAVKPLCGNQGKGVTTAVSDAKAVGAAFSYAQQFGSKVIVEQHIEGNDYRVLVIGDKVVAASRRLPPEVIGDGTSTIRQLVAAVNADPHRGKGHEKVLTKIRLDQTAVTELTRQGLEANSVPCAGRVVSVRGNANLSTGGSAEDVTQKIHADTALACMRAARKIGLDVAGIDLVCRDIAQPLQAQGGAIIEVNAAPGIRMHEHPSCGERNYVGRAIVDSLFAPGNDGRVPIIAITGSNGKTTTTLSVAHVLQQLGYVTGVATTEGISIAGQSISTGDCSGYWSARTVLTSPEVEFAVLETARGGILKRGLGFDQCDVGIVLNIHNDHLGQDGIETLQDLARVKAIVVATARKAVVLNADDALCVEMARTAPAGTEVIFFGFDVTHPVLAEHLAQNGRAVYLDNDILIWADGDNHLPLTSLDQLPNTLNGHARHNIANAMASFAALLALAVPAQHIASALSSFSPGERQTPLRLNLYQAGNVTLMMDYAHNATAYEAIIATGRQLTQGRLIGVVSVPCDRRETDLIAIGQLCGAGFDELVVYEMDDLRDTMPGATAELIARGALAAQQTKAYAANGQQWVHTHLDIRAAIRSAYSKAEPGDLIIIGCASYVSELWDALGNVGLTRIDASTLAYSAGESSDWNFSPYHQSGSMDYAQPQIAASEGK
ncbi:cyanophycin synthetase [Rheinheimera sp. A13L]|uniref:cyanophycin synthetase n=1 Tax=Rheinheimera sp. A13L TaxID=506534 RepID=UPI0002124BA1|nr:cyanophycin synthetase [Rheinheimera sp. A13L]EGM79046.1 cyanophycin synthetase [Rheinheimera sp. A13L]